jgi:predicted glutamine amidotransferase
MCKLAGWAGQTAKPLNAAAANRAILAARLEMQKTERDGFGFAQAGQNGLHGRFLQPEAFKGLDALPTLKRVAGAAFDAFAISKRAEQSGSYKPNRSVIIHGRTATHGQGVPNTHPFRRNGWSMAHNGVISWNGKPSELHKAATCDSQHILYCLTENGTDETRRKDLESIQGYAAFLALAPNGDMIAAVDATANLCAGITSKGRWIFGTTPALVETIADAWKCSTVEAFKLEAWTWLRFPAAGGEPKLSNWTHAAASYREAKFSGRSLGRKWSADTETEKAFTRFPDFEGSSYTAGAWSK